MTALRVAIVVVSDRAARGERPDRTAPLLVAALARHGFEARPARVVPDDREAIAAALREAARDADVVLATGGTGIAPRDVTPEATRDVIERELPGLGEAMRAASRAALPTADLSRATAGVLGRALIVDLPGSPRGAVECLEVVLPVFRHAVGLLSGVAADCGAPRPGGSSVA